MNKFTDRLKQYLLEDIIDDVVTNDALAQEDPAYITALSNYLNVEAPDLFKFFATALDYDSIDEVEKDKDKMDEEDYLIYHKFQDTFGHLENDLTDDDLNKIGTTRQDYNDFHKEN